MKIGPKMIKIWPLKVWHFFRNCSVRYVVLLCSSFRQWNSAKFSQTWLDLFFLYKKSSIRDLVVFSTKPELVNFSEINNFEIHSSHLLFFSNFRVKVKVKGQFSGINIFCRCSGRRLSPIFFLKKNLAKNLKKYLVMSENCYGYRSDFKISNFKIFQISKFFEFQGQGQPFSGIVQVSGT